MSWRGLKTPTLRREAGPTFEFFSSPPFTVLNQPVSGNGKNTIGKRDRE